MGSQAFHADLLARADAMQFRGTFEAHLTVEADSVERVAAFRALCDELDVKCVLIELASADAMQFRGTFEAHLTVEADGAERVAAFRALCDELDVKCVLIELARGQTRQQPMTASYHRGAFGSVVPEIERLHAALLERGFPVVRVKVEAVVPTEGLPDRDVAAFPGGYFEFHAKLRLAGDVDVAALSALCVEHGAHLSRNDRKRDPRGAAERFVTLRVHATTSAVAGAQFDRLVDALEAAGYAVVGTKRELTIYDGKVELDAGWLA